MKIGYQKDLTWTVVKAKKKKKSRNENNRSSFWNEEEKNKENDLGFEVVFEKNKNDKILKDVDQTNCLVGKFSNDFSDSEIEVVSCPDENRLYSNVLTRNIALHNDSVASQRMKLSFEGFKELLNEDFFLEDSDIEVIDKTSNIQSTSDCNFKIFDIEREKQINNESLEIIFDENWHAGLFEGDENLIEKEKIYEVAEYENKENIACLRMCVSKCYCDQLFESSENTFLPRKSKNRAPTQGKLSKDSDDEEYGIKSMFERASCDFGERFDNTDDVITMKTSTLALLFCISIIVAVHAGNGFGFVKEKSSTPAPTQPSLAPPKNKDILQESNYENINFKLLRASSETKSALKTLLTSLRLLQEKHSQLQEIHDETMKNFNIQKQMTWYWRRKVTLDDHNGNEDGNSKNQENKNNRLLIAQFENIIHKLNISLVEAKLEAKLWKKRFFSSRLQNQNILNKNYLSNISFSKCLFYFSNVLDVPLMNLSKYKETPLGILKKDNKSAWSNIKNSWKTQKNDNDNLDKKTRLVNRKNKNYCLERKNNYYIELADLQKKHKNTIKEGKKSAETVSINEKALTETNETKTVIIDCGDHQIKVVTENQFPEQPTKMEYCKVNGIAITVLKGKVQIVSAVDNTSLYKNVSAINDKPVMINKLDKKKSKNHSKLVKDNENNKEENENAGAKKQYKNENKKIHHSHQTSSSQVLDGSSSQVQSIFTEMNRKLSKVQAEQRNSSQRLNKEMMYFEDKIEKMTSSFFGDKEYFSIENEKLTRRLEILELKLNQVINQTITEDEKDLKKKGARCKGEYNDQIRRTSEERKSKERINKIAFYKTKLQQAVKEIKDLKRKLQIQVKLFKSEAFIEILGKKINTYRRLLQERKYPSNANKKIVHLKSKASSFYNKEKDRVPLAQNIESDKKLYYRDNSLNLKIEEDTFPHMSIDEFVRPPLALKEKNMFENSNKQHKFYQPENKSRFLNKHTPICKKEKSEIFVMKSKTRNKNLVKDSSTKLSKKSSLSKKYSHKLKNTVSEKKSFLENKKAKKTISHINQQDFLKSAEPTCEYESENSKLQTKETSNFFTLYSMHQAKTCHVFQKTADNQKSLKKDRRSNFLKVTKPPSLRVIPPKSVMVKPFSSLSIDTPWYFDIKPEKNNNFQDDEDDNEDEPFYLN